MKDNVTNTYAISTTKSPIPEWIAQQHAEAYDIALACALDLAAHTRVIDFSEIQRAGGYLRTSDDYISRKMINTYCGRQFFGFSAEQIPEKKCIDLTFALEARAGEKYLGHDMYLLEMFEPAFIWQGRVKFEKANGPLVMPVVVKQEIEYTLPGLYRIGHIDPRDVPGNLFDTSAVLEAQMI